LVGDRLVYRGQYWPFIIPVLLQVIR